MKYDQSQMNKIWQSKIFRFIFALVIFKMYVHINIHIFFEDLDVSNSDIAFDDTVCCLDSSFRFEKEPCAMLAQLRARLVFCIGVWRSEIECPASI